MNTATRRVLMSSGKDDWETPTDLFADLHREFDFALDVAATVGNRKVANYIGPGNPNEQLRDALRVSWADLLHHMGYQGRACWCNPPYSRGLQSRFIAKAASEALEHGVRTVMLIPARTDTAAFHRHVWDGERHELRPWVTGLRFLKGRVRFVGATHGAPFPSMVVVFG